MAFPRMFTVLQKFPNRRLEDIPGAVEAELQRENFAAKVRPGGTIAIGVGSRGISNSAAIVKAVVAYWNDNGFAPFIFPAMGSHGAATAQGQTDVLAKYGINPESMGCPIRSSLDTVSIGATPEGIEAHLDKHAFGSDGIMMIGRVKWHTDFEGKLESGLFKMMAIGLGKWTGAATYHSRAFSLGLEQVIRSVGRQVLATGKIIGGLAILEDARHNTAEVHAVPAATMERREEELLARVKSWMGRIPFDLDLLIIDEIGKNISGAGMDTRVVNRGVAGQYNPWANTPRITRIFVREMSPYSYGNASGVGMADIVTDRLVEAIDLRPLYINTLTSLSPACARIPMHFATDRECIERISKTCGKETMSTLRIGRIHNTLELSPIALSETLRAEIESNEMLEIAGPPEELAYDEGGNLLPLQQSLHVLSDDVDLDVETVAGSAR
jgi:hypothetical protein